MALNRLTWQRCLADIRENGGGGGGGGGATIGDLVVIAWVDAPVPEDGTYSNFGNRAISYPSYQLGIGENIFCNMWLNIDGFSFGSSIGIASGTTCIPAKVTPYVVEGSTADDIEFGAFLADWSMNVDSETNAVSFTFDNVEEVDVEMVMELSENYVEFNFDVPDVVTSTPDEVDSYMVEGVGESVRALFMYVYDTNDTDAEWLTPESNEPGE